MKIYKLGCKVTVSAYTEIEADTLESALKQAANREVVLGGVGSGSSPDESWIIDDADGEPSEIHED